MDDLQRRMSGTPPIPLLPFVGAGLSIPMGFPSWGRFLEDLAAECGQQHEVETLLRSGSYAEAAEAVEYALGYAIFNKRVSHTFGERRSNDCELRGPILAVPDLASGAVITTNFDRVLERAFSQAGAPFGNVVRGAQVDSIRRAIADNLPYLVKIHGDAEERTGRVLTKTEYDAHYGPTGPNGLRAQLSRIFQGRTLLFLGCSLAQDRTLDVLLDVLQQVSGIEHYAIVERPAVDNDLFEKQRRLGDRGILPIWYPTGQHALIEPLIRWISQKEDRQALLAQTEEFLNTIRYLRKKDLIDQEIALKKQDEALNRFWVSGLGGRQ